MTIVFRIGPTMEGARKFVYHIGANRFNTLLSIESQEAVRTIIHTISFDLVQAQRRDIASKLLTILRNKYCNQYGVDMMDVTIARIILPSEIQVQLERITSHQQAIQQSQKLHKSKVRTLKSEAQKEMESIRTSNQRKLQEIIAQRNKHEIEHRLVQERTRGESRVEEVKAMTDAEIALLRAEGEERVMKVVAMKEAEALLKQAQLECQKLRIEAEQKAIIMVKESEAQKKVAEAQAQSIIAKAAVEAESGNDLDEKRRYELEWARLKVLEKLASKGRRFISGEMGESILNQLVPLSNDNF